jgi:hypothetical protein
MCQDQTNDGDRNLSGRQQPSVAITLDCGQATIGQEYGPLIKPLLTWRSFSFRTGGEFGVKVAKNFAGLYGEDGRGGLRFPAAFVRAAKRELERAGLRVEVQDRSEIPPNAQPDGSVLADASGWERTLMTLLASQRRGVVEYRSEAELVDGVLCACRLFSKARTLLAAKNRDQVRLLYTHLKKQFGSGVHSHRTWSLDRPVQRLIGTLETLKGFNPDDWDLVILPAAVEALTPAHRDALWRARFKAVFGFVRRGTRLNRAMSLCLRGLVGPVIAAGGTAFQERAAVNVVWAAPPAFAPVPRELSVLEFKRIAFWANDARNTQIAAIAAALAEGRTNEALVAAGCGPWAGQHALFEEPARVVVLVESLEHARRLREKLPGWRVLDAAPPALPTSGWGGFAADRDFVDLTDGPAIMTEARAEKLCRHNFSVLVRAGGGPWPLDVRGFPPPDDAGEVLLVDIADHGDAEVLAASRQRADDYRERGWHCAWAPAWLDGFVR